MKRVGSALAAVLLLGSMAACGGDKDPVDVNPGKGDDVNIEGPDNEKGDD